MFLFSLLFTPQFWYDKSSWQFEKLIHRVFSFFKFRFCFQISHHSRSGRLTRHQRILEQVGVKIFILYFYGATRCLIVIVWQQLKHILPHGSKTVGKREIKCLG